MNDLIFGIIPDIITISDIESYGFACFGIPCIEPDPVIKFVIVR